MVQAYLALRRATKPKGIGTMTQWVYTFGDGKAEGDAGMKNLLGGKGANLAEMSNLGLPVPPGFTITTEVCTYYYDHGQSYPPELKAQVDEGAGRRRASSRAAPSAMPENPLLVSVRSGARASMPGMMDTVLNLGLNDVTVDAVAKGAGRRALRLRQLSPLHHDVFERGARHRAPPFRGGPRRVQGPQGLYPRHRPDRRGLEGADPALQGASSRRSSASPSRRIRRSSSGAPSAPCSAPG